MDTCVCTFVTTLPTSRKEPTWLGMCLTRTGERRAKAAAAAPGPGVIPTLRGPLCTAGRRRGLPSIRMFLSSAQFSSPRAIRQEVLMTKAEVEHSPVLLSEAQWAHARQGCACLQLKCHTRAPHCEQTCWPGALMHVPRHP